VSEPEDPARRFLDQTVPKHDEWEGREPDDGPARPRHIQRPAVPQAPLAPLSPKERRKNAITSAAWTVGPAAAFVAGAALSDDDGIDPDPEPDPGGFGDIGSGL
jgi:hypothetical protein